MKRKNNFLYQPPSEWMPPEKFPNLKDAKIISVDLETRDPNLIKMGPGWARGDGNIVGIAVSNGDRAWYFPFGHGGGYNLSESVVKKWAKDVLENPNIKKIFHNAPYDVGWLRQWGIKVKGTIYDTMIAAPLVDENRFSYTLDSLSRDQQMRELCGMLGYYLFIEWLYSSGYIDFEAYKCSISGAIYPKY